MRLKDRVAIVTGGATGIGLAIVRRLADEGASVVIADIKGAKDAAQGLSGSNRPVMAIEADVSSEDSVAVMVKRTIDRFGRIDILVNNAAVSATLALKPFEELTVAEWRRVFDVNAIGVFLCCRAVASHMRARKSGRIVNIASGTAFKGAPFLLHYVASKGAVISMTRSLARELGPDSIAVNAIAPGLVLVEATEYVPEERRQLYVSGRAMQRAQHPEDVTGVVVFLLGQGAGFVTGQLLPVNGGFVFN